MRRGQARDAQRLWSKALCATFEQPSVHPDPSQRTTKPRDYFCFKMNPSLGSRDRETLVTPFLTFPLMYHVCGPSRSARDMLVSTRNPRQSRRVSGICEIAKRKQDPLPVLGFFIFSKLFSLLPRQKHPICEANQSTFSPRLTTTARRRTWCAMTRRVCLKQKMVPNMNRLIHLRGKSP